MDPLVREGRRAATWYSYVFLGKRSPYGPAGPVEHSDDWTVRLGRPRTRIYGTAEGRPKHPLKKVHLVRDEVVATHRQGAQVRWTHWLCGGSTFEAALTSSAPLAVCAQCLVVFQGRKMDPLPV